MIPAFLDKSQIVEKPGVYIFKDQNQEILYVGKAINLKNRINQYFSGHTGNSLRTAAMVEKIRSVETIAVESELEALILEANLIKKHLPPYNIRLTDDKDYLYIKVTNEDYPRILTARKQDLKGVLKYFGPFPSGGTVRSTLKLLRRVFPWCDNPRKGRACFHYHIGQCPGPCVGQITKGEYRKIITRFSALMEGRVKQLGKQLIGEMQSLSGQQKYEEAGHIKKILAGMTYLTQPNRVQVYLENPNFLEDQGQQALIELQQDLNLPTLPERIEAYDISNVQGVDATGSMVVLTHGDIDKSQYRRFKIKISGKPNDYAMHAEMMRRRLKNDWPLPDLFLIDGGRGQVRASAIELKKAGVNRPVYGIAKRMEWLYPPEGEVIKLPHRRLSLRLLQKIRDESHRFAITYYRKLHRKSTLGI